MTLNIITRVQLRKSSWEGLYDRDNFWTIMTEVSEAAEAFEHKPFINFNEDQKSVCTSPKLLQNTSLLMCEQVCHPFDISLLSWCWE